MVVSDHSPCTPDLKFLTPSGDQFGHFLKAWGGIASVQFGLSLFWTACISRGLSIFDINKYMTRATARLVGLHKYKGKLAPDYDADFVIWNPNETFIVDDSVVLHKNKVPTDTSNSQFLLLTYSLFKGNSI